MFNTYKLSNGLTVLTIPHEASQAVIVDAFVRVGSRNEEERLNGISHFLEHVNFKGTEKYKTARKLSEAVDSVGGEFNAMTDNESTQYYVQVAAEQLPLAVDIISQVFLHPTFPTAEVEREKGVVIEEINMYDDNPAKMVMQKFHEAMWSEHPFGRPVIGTKENIRAITRDDLINYRKAYYSPANTVIAVAGKFNEEEVTKLIEKHWSGYRHDTPLLEALPADKAFQKAVVVERKDTKQAHFILGFRSFPMFDKRAAVLDVLSSILSGGMSSRLWSEVREKRGLGYYVQGGEHAFSDTGLFMVRAGVEIKNIHTALEVVVKELAKIKKTLVSAAELKKGKENRKGQLALAWEDIHFQMNWYLDQVAFAQKIDTLQEWFNQIDLVTAQEIREVAREIMIPEKSTFAVIGPYTEKDEAEFAKIVAKL